MAERVDISRITTSVLAEFEARRELSVAQATFGLDLLPTGNFYEGPPKSTPVIQKPKGRQRIFHQSGYAAIVKVKNPI